MKKFTMAVLLLVVSTGIVSADDPWTPKIASPDLSFFDQLTQMWQGLMSYF